MIKNKIFSILALIFLISPLDAKDSFKTEDIYSIKSLSLSDVSDDGSSLIFETSEANKKEDNYKSTLYYLDIKKGKREMILQSHGRRGMSFSSVRFSGDKKSIYFLSSGLSASKKDGVQVWSMSLSNRIKKRVL